MQQYYMQSTCLKKKVCFCWSSLGFNRMYIIRGPHLATEASTCRVLEESAQWQLPCPHPFLALSSKSIHLHPGGGPGWRKAGGRKRRTWKEGRHWILICVLNKWKGLLHWWEIKAQRHAHSYPLEIAGRIDTGRRKQLFLWQVCSLCISLTFISAMYLFIYLLIAALCLSNVLCLTSLTLPCSIELTSTGEDNRSWWLKPSLQTSNKHKEMASLPTSKGVMKMYKQGMQ